MNAILLGVNAALVALWIYAVVDCVRSQRSYWWIAATSLGFLTLYLTTIAYLVNFKVLPLLGSRPLDDALAGRREHERLALLARERGTFEDHVALAESFAAAGQWGDALPALAKAQELDAHDARAQGLAGIALLRTGRTEAAISHLEFATEEPGGRRNGLFWLRLAEAYLAASRAGDAERALRESLRQDRLAEAAVRLALLLSQSGRGAEAAEHLKVVVDGGASGKLGPGETDNRPWLDEARRLLKELGG